ncbi:hypothetical protein yc1106_00807 [Curvularia clavata]|uniref:Extracellular mutant protein 11 C-terminal domain-containing protein n=1 Tax=Curvularia clavata TaxID=95742 RepID=A0A9Q8Z3Z3_CURCL|nr:hypothetical protein yc1106_00807 [Curvularia clavata]
MQGLQNFVSRKHTNSPHNALDGDQPAPKTDRQTVGANARVSIKNGLPSQRRTPIPGALGRGSANAQNSSAVLQNPPRRVQSAQGHTVKRDLYDTDAESLDTTIDHSVIQAQESQQMDRHYQQNEQAFDLGNDGGIEQGHPDSSSSDHAFEITHDEEEFLEEQGLGNLPLDRKIAFLQHARQFEFREIDGDSYPTTTNGEPSELDGLQEPPSDYRHKGGKTSPLHQPQNIKYESVQPEVRQQTHYQQKLHMPAPRQSLPKPSQLFEQSAQLRDQTRASAPTVQQARQDTQHHRIVPQSSQPTAFSQANAGVAVATLPAHSNPYPNVKNEAYGQQYVHHQHPGPSRVQLNVEEVKPIAQPVPVERPFVAQAIPKQIVYQPQPEEVPTDEPEAMQVEDYDPETLFQMNYETLKNESFDIDPRAKRPVLSEEDTKKPLAERLILVQKNLDPAKQAEFFHSLPTSEWEDAGDWFLDQCQNMIQRMKQARQKKRKLAQEFEDEMEKRHKHVSKKHRQVEQAMEKMKAQGENLVPRSPRPSRSAKPKRS